MDLGFKSYVVLKVVSMAQRTGDQLWLSMLVSNSFKQNLELDVQNLEDINIWNNFYTIPIKEIEEIINKLMKRKIIYSKSIQVEGKRFSMFFLSSKGKKILHILDRKYYSDIDKKYFINSENWDTIKERSSIIYSHFNYQSYNVFS